MICGVYRIRNLKNGKVYPGSSENIKARWREHKSELKKRKHDNKHLENSWYKYGKESFVFEVLEECAKEMLLIREQVYLDQVRVRNVDGALGEIDHNLAYNMYAIAGSPRGYKLSEATKKKISESVRGVKNPFWGKHFTEEHKRNIGLASKGRRHSEEAKKKMSESRCGEKSHNYGKHFSVEIRKKISENHADFSGEKNGRSKLVWATVEEIREKFSTGNCTQRELAKEYCVCFTAISRIINNKSWKYIQKENE